MAALSNLPNALTSTALASASSPASASAAVFPAQPPPNGANFCNGHTLASSQPEVQTLGGQPQAQTPPQGLAQVKEEAAVVAAVVEETEQRSGGSEGDGGCNGGGEGGDVGEVVASAGAGTLDLGTATGVSAGTDAGSGAGNTDPEVLLKYQNAANTIGTRFVSKSSETFVPTGDPRKDFLTDHYHFMTEIGCRFKLRQVGGGELDLYALYKAVLERGGLQSVTFNREFKMVARTLQLPKTCTSASFILRSEYEKLLYVYEQKHVWNRSPSEIPPVAKLNRRKSSSRNASLHARTSNSLSSGPIASTSGTAGLSQERSLQTSTVQQSPFYNTGSSNIGNIASGAAAVSDGNPSTLNSSSTATVTIYPLQH